MTDSAFYNSVRKHQSALGLWLAALPFVLRFAPGLLSRIVVKM
jgi:hypothetical protein